jgi:hypothetical protein
LVADGSRAFEYDVALSFSGEQRPYVEAVAAKLHAHGVKYFYDAEQEALLWGAHLGEKLHQIYAQDAALVVMFISADYARKDWPRHERRAALDRAIRERHEYVLPARFDETILPGLSPSTGYVDLNGRTPEDLAALIVKKLKLVYGPPQWLEVLDPSAELHRPTGIVHHAGHLYVADHTAGAVVKMSEAGSELARVGGFLHPHHLYRVDERIVVCDTGNNRLVALGSDLKEHWSRKRFGPVTVRSPHGITSADAASFLTVSTENNALLSVVKGRLELLRQNRGGLPASGPGEFRSPCGVAATEAHVYVADTFNHRVQVFDRQLRFLGAFGSPGQDHAQMSYPVGVLAWHQGYVLVADERNQRLQMWQLAMASASITAECVASDLCGSWLGSPFGMSRQVHEDVVYVADRKRARILKVDLPGALSAARRGLNPYVGS